MSWADLGTMTAGELASRFDCSWPTTTRHLEALCEARLINAERHGREQRYPLDHEMLRSIAGNWLGRFDPGEQE